MEVLPYRWGKFQGWLFVLGAPIFLLVDVYILFFPVMRVPRFAVIESVVLCPLAFFMGLGILKKKVYGLYLVYLMLVFFVVNSFISLANQVNTAETEWVATLGQRFVIDKLPSLVAWIICTVYYFNRRAEFR